MNKVRGYKIFSVKPLIKTIKTQKIMHLVGS